MEEVLPIGEFEEEEGEVCCSIVETAVGGDEGGVKRDLVRL